MVVIQDVCILLVPPLFFLEVMALLTGCLGNNQARLPLAFEVEGAATIPEIGIVGNVIVCAVNACYGLVA
jgi:hypothetical protein